MQARIALAMVLYGIGIIWSLLFGVAAAYIIIQLWQETQSLSATIIVFLLQFSPAAFGTWLQYLLIIGIAVGLFALASWLHGEKAQLRVWGTLTIIGSLWSYLAGPLALGILVWDFFNPIVLSGATPDAVVEVSLLGWFWWVWGIMLTVPGLVFLAPLALQAEWGTSERK